MGSQKGFTAIELLVVLAILGVLLGLAVVSMGPQIAHYRLNNAAKETLSALRREAQTAISQNLNRNVNFRPFTALECAGVDLSFPCFGLVAPGALRPLPLGITYGVGGVGVPVNGTPDVGGLPIPADGITFTGNQITFQTNKTPNQAGEIYLTNTRGENMAVSVNLVGRIRCWRWGSGGAWINC